MRYVLIVLLPSLVLAAEAPPVPTGYDLFKLPVGEFRAYVAGIVEGFATVATQVRIGCFLLTLVTEVAFCLGYC